MMGRIQRRVRRASPRARRLVAALAVTVLTIGAAWALGLLWSRTGDAGWHVAFERFADRAVDLLLRPAYYTLSVVHAMLFAGMVVKGPANRIEWSMCRFVASKMLLWLWLAGDTFPRDSPPTTLLMIALVLATALDLAGQWFWRYVLGDPPGLAHFLRWAWRRRRGVVNTVV